MFLSRHSAWTIGLVCLAAAGSISVSHAHDSFARPTNYAILVRGGAAPAKAAPVRVAPAKAGSKESSAATPTSGIAAQVFNLIKSIVGAGVLGLPAGIAAFGDSPTAVLPALVLMCTIGVLSAYAFYMIGTLCAKTDSTSYRMAWSRTVGEGTAWVPAAACLMVTFCAVLMYSMILADTIPSIFKAFAGIAMTRTTGLLGTTLFALLPLCLLKNLSSLAPFSLVGIIGVLYTATVMMTRWLSGNYASSFNVPASFGNAGWKSVFSPNSAILVSMLSTAFMAHYNAPKFYFELKTEPRFRKTVVSSFVGAVLLMSTIAVSGYCTFGSATQSLILNNYAVNDLPMSFSRVAITASLLFSYPLAFVGVRQGVMDVWNVPAAARTDSLSDILTVALLSTVTLLAYFLKDIRLIMSFGGATWGNCVIYLFPALMMVVQARKEKQGSLQQHVKPAILTGVTGLCLGIIGTVRAIQSM